MVITINESKEFVPAWNGNKELPAVDQIKVCHKAPTVDIKERVTPRRYEYDSNGAVTGSFEVDRKKVLAAMVTSISGLSCMDENSVERKITTVDQLFKAPSVFDPLIDEIYAYLQEQLNKQISEKN